MLDRQIISSKCRDILKNHHDTLTYIIDEIKREQESPIHLDTVDKIALEYKKRQGVREGLVLFMQRLNSKADMKD